METSPTKKPRLASIKGKKKGGRAMARLRSLKGETNKDTPSSGSDVTGLNDHGFRDVRTLTEKMRLLTWVDSISYLRIDVDDRQMHTTKMEECPWEHRGLPP
jgi:hypothetical protein